MTGPFKLFYGVLLNIIYEHLLLFIEDYQALIEHVKKVRLLKILLISIFQVDIHILFKYAF
jgi:hypothetical protein